ncbi:MAG TPA: tetratricopeptide repeat protein [Alphaproteobacteria bacterium]|nr:tetratricopeptide repeat protein [Alphaproteobacteria bacterium]
MDSLLDLAFDAVEEHRLDRAEALCRQVLTLEPRNFQATLLLGALAGQGGRATEAIALLGDALALDPDSTDARLQLAGFLRAEGRLDEATRLLEEAVGLEPDNVIAQNDLAVLYLEAARQSEALACLEQAILLKPDDPTAHHRFGMILDVQGREDEAVAAYRRAIALDPDFAEAHESLANLFYLQGHALEAADHYRKAAEAQPESPSGRRSRAWLIFEGGQPAEAEAYLRQSLSADPDNGGLHHLLGNVLNQMGRFDEATSCFEAALATDKRHVMSFEALVRAKTVTDRSLVARMEALLATGGFSDHKRVSLHFALGKALDDLGDHEAAMSHFDAGNRLKRQWARFDREKFTRFVDNTIRLYTRDVISRSVGAGSEAALPILIVGMPRSGTTLLEQIVSSHPDVVAGDELTFWSDTIQRLGEVPLTPAPLGRIAAEYLALLRRIGPSAARVTDKMPENFRWAGLIHATFPNARIIHCRRNPPDTCLSIYFTHFNMGHEFTYSREDIAFFYRQYARLMAHWRRVIPADRLLEIDYEELVSDRERVTRRLIAFCGLDWNEGCLAPERNRRAVKTASLWQARQPVYRRSVERWRNYEPWIPEFLSLERG